MLILSLPAIIVGFVLLLYGNVLNLDGHCFERDMTIVIGNLTKYGIATPGETFVTIGTIILIIGIVILFIFIFNNKAQSLETNLVLSLDLVIPSAILLISMIFSWIGQSSYQSTADDLHNILNAFTDDSYFEKIAAKAVAGQHLIMWGGILAGIGGLVLTFNILKRRFSTETALSAYIVTAAALSSLLLLTKPICGLNIPSTYKKVDFYVQPFSFMSDNGTYDISSAYINLWCAFLFILIFVFLAATILSQFTNIPKTSLISSGGSFGALLLMLLGLMAIYSLLNNNMSVGHSLTVYAEYGYCVFLSLFAFIANIIRVNILETKN